MWPFKKRTADISGVFEAYENAANGLDKIFDDAVKEYGITKAMELFYETADFVIARNEIADFFKMVEAENAKEGKGAPLYKTEFIEGWRRFRVNPCAVTARSWLAASPQYRKLICSYIVHSCPGGNWHTAAKFKTDLSTPRQW